MTKYDIDYDIDIDEFEKYLQINEYDLDNDIVQQPSLYFRVGRALSRMESVRDELYRKTKEVEADLADSLRNEMLEEGQKPTDTAVKNAVTCHKTTKNAFRKYEEARAKAGELGKLEAAFTQRSYMIRDLVSRSIAAMHHKESISVGGKQEQEVRARANRVSLSEGRKPLRKKRKKE